MNEDFLYKKIEERVSQRAYRQLILPNGKIDFCSNDYLGIVKKGLLKIPGELASGSTGSRLLTGNSELIEETEKFIADFHYAKAGLIYNSGYDANIGLLSCVPQRGDTVLYDYLSHASIRDGIRLSLAASFSFQHNHLEDLEKKLKQAKGNIFVVTESVFSMDGDMPPLAEIVKLCQVFGAHLIVDEAHATGVIGTKGAGLVQHLNLQEFCFARIHTFGKALGCHGAIVLGSDLLRNYLVNFSRSFIYTTALPAATVQAIKNTYKIFPYLNNEREQLNNLVKKFQAEDIRYEKLISTTPLHAVIVQGNDFAKKLALRCQEKNLDIRAIRYPTVPKGSERLRIILHAFNTEAELALLIQALK